MDTFFAPAGRDTPEQLQRRLAIVQRAPFICQILDAFPLPVLILNEKRQAIVANHKMLRILGMPADEVFGRRLGESVGCSHWREGTDGCGTAPHCMTCGAVDAILVSQSSPVPITRECRVSVDSAIDGRALDLRVTAAALVVDEERFTLCTIEDISQQKRLAVLTRVFFHDVLNTAGGIQGLAQLLVQSLPAEWQQRDEPRLLGSLAEQLIEEIESQRDLTRAESGDLELHPIVVRVDDLLQELRALYSSHPVARGRTIEVKHVWDGRMMTDARLLARVLGNMLKNALEATPCGGAVTVACEDHGKEVLFTVHNTAVMPEEVRIQVFHRSFSTKAESGRGIGTYSMKLLGETYLGGRIGFVSRDPEGTTFSLCLPKVLLGTKATAPRE